MTHLHIPLWTRFGAVTAVALVCALPQAALAQQSGDTPGFRLGLTNSFVANDNRGLDGTSQGSTFEFITRLNFDLTFATPIQQLEISGDIGLRTLSGAESDTLDTGLVDPNLTIGYARQSRDAALSVDVFHRQADASTSAFEFLPGVPDPTLVTADGTRLTYGFDTSLELRRRAPFGMTFTAGSTALRYSDGAAATLSDQDRFRLGANFRFDLNPTTRATLDLRYSTFEDFGTPEGVRETYSLNSSLRQTLPNGAATMSFGVTSTPEGERYTLSAGRSIETAVLELGGTFGLTRAIDGDIYPTGTVDLTRTLPDGSLGASLSRSIAAGSNDNEQEITSLNLSYAKQFSRGTSFNATFSYSETDPTGAGATTSLSSVGINLERNLTANWQMSVGLQHRISEGATGIRARDNRLSIDLRSDLFVRR